MLEVGLENLLKKIKNKGPSPLFCQALMRTLLLEFHPGFFPLIYYEILKFEREKSDSLMLSVENELWNTGKVNYDRKKKLKRFKFVFLYYAQRQLTFKSKFDYCFHCFWYYYFFLVFELQHQMSKQITMSVGRKCT